jgi:ABC-type sugar transport system ATPase subunit
LNSEGLNSLPVQVALVEALGHETCLSCVFDAEDGVKTPLQVRIDPQQVVRNHERLWLEVDPRRIHLFEASGAVIHPM